MSGTKRKAVQAVLIGGGAVLLALGILFGDLPVILTKAIFICLECIGIG